MIANSRTRLEPVARDPTLVEGLMARVADPLWLLGRQWNLAGEFLGVDGGSPAWAVLQPTISRLTRYLPGLPDGRTGAIMNVEGLPLEARIENEWQPRQELLAWYMARTGLHYLRLLAGSFTIAALAVYKSGLLAKYPLPARDEAGVLIDDPGLLLLSGRTLDGQALYTELAASLRAPAGGLPPQPPLGGLDPTAVTAIANTFLAWYDAVSGRDIPDSPAWHSNRQEYAASVAAPLPESEVVFTTTEHVSGDLDWFSFDVAPGATLGALKSDPGGPPTTTARGAMPTRVTFRGAPAARFWQLEDSRVDIGAIKANPEDLVTMLVVDFALRFGNDFYSFPLPLALGSVCRIDSLTVSDTFGLKLLIPSTADVDGPNGPFRLFEHTVAGQDSRISIFVMFPNLDHSIHSAPFEDVQLLRDEAADVCWAIERTALNAIGMVVDRGAVAAAGAPAPPQQVAPPMVNGVPSLHYLIRTPIATNWYPVIPVTEMPGASMRIGHLVPLVGQPAQPTPSTRLLREMDGVEVPAEEITRAGTSLTRSWHYARGADGRQFLWVGRRAALGRTPASSGLRYDVTDSPTL